jgi:hypothetical protein
VFEQWFHTTLANTSEANADRVQCKISNGILRGIYIYFPSGCCYLAKCRVFLGEKPVIPRSAKGYIAGEGTLVPATHLFDDITENLNVLNWIVWNEDTTYPHTLFLIAEWTSEDELKAQKDLLSSIDLGISKMVEVMTGE